MSALALACALALASACSSCLSVQFRGADGRPRVLGVAWRERIDLEEGEVHRARTPGVAIRIWPPPGSLAFGFSEEVVLIADGDGKEVVEAVAFQHTLYGVGVTTQGVALGYARGFLVPCPDTEQGIVQFVSFNEADLESSVVYRKEFP